MSCMTSYIIFYRLYETEGDLGVVAEVVLSNVEATEFDTVCQQITLQGFEIFEVSKSEHVPFLGCCCCCW